MTKPAPRPAIATYRLQFRGGMDFERAAGIVPYLARLGVSHLYASPIFKARAGSTHGYDVADPTRLDPALGGEAGFAGLVAALEGEGMGLLLDIVPNHVGVGADNPWWQDLLRWGEDSPKARFFDVDWRALAGGTPGRLLLPQLGGPYGKVLAGGGLKVGVQTNPATLDLAYYDNRFPLDPRTWPLILEGRIDAALLDRLRTATPETWPDLEADLAGALEGLPETLDLPQDGLHALLEAQPWRLAWWRSGNAMLNWRRFFDITELAGLRIEDEAVFDEAHRLVLDLYGKGEVDGLRIDHVDGLAEPGTYLKRLAAAMRGARPDVEPWILVEKILGEDEDLPTDWPVAGTTGYETVNLLLGLFVAPEGEAALDRLYQEMGGDPEGFPAIVKAAKREILDKALAAEIRRLAVRLVVLAADDRSARDLPLDAVEDALKALVVAFPVYRTYGGDGGFSPEDRARLRGALQQAEADLALPDPFVVRFLEDVFLERGAGDAATRPLLKAFEQLTGPAMAKSLEDTAFYRWHRLVALNEVGGEPDRFGVAPEAAHAFLKERAERWPEALVATATHDTKRGEDTRLRIAALSEVADDWANEVAAWRELNEPHKTAHDGAPWPDAPTEYLLYQMLVGAYPLDASPDLGDLADRLVAYLEKACREAKLRTGWLAPNPAYEEAVAAFARAVLDPAGSAAFLGRLRAFLDRLAPVGALNGLAQTVLKLTVPGVPDVYQGTEFWDQSTVDPDNRRPVDWDARERALAADAPLDDLLASWRDGRLKQRLIHRVLDLRARHPRLLTHGRYLPLEATGAEAGRVFAFARLGEDGTAALVAVPRRAGALLAEADGLLPPPQRWGDTAIRLPDDLAGRAGSDVLADGAATGLPSRLPLDRLFARLPFAVLLLTP
ncbi:MAG: malto-oligosyltrehalose synthase [Geminicoccaceae bacterium]|nr:malto-oligosyltrehalose synthase [Geminicoccaceae bacterium]